MDKIKYFIVWWIGIAIISVLIFLTLGINIKKPEIEGLLLSSTIVATVLTYFEFKNKSI